MRRGEEEDPISPARLEFQGRWISYAKLYARVEEKTLHDRLAFDGKLFVAFFCVVLLLTISKDASTSHRAASKLAVYETLVYPRFRSASSSLSPSAAPHFIDFYGIHTRQDYARWLHDVLRNQIYTHDGSKASAAKVNGDDLLIHGTQSILWGISIRQQRVKGESALDVSNCCIPDSLKGARLTCSPPFGVYGASLFPGAPPVESREAFGDCTFMANYSGSDNETCQRPYVYQTEAETGRAGGLSGADLASGFGSSYDGGGFEILLSKNSSIAVPQIEALLGRRGDSANRDDSTTPFVDEHTRLMVVTVQTYTVPTNIVLKCELIVEFDSSGAARSKVQTYSSDRWMNQVIPR